MSKVAKIALGSALALVLSGPLLAFTLVDEGGKQVKQIQPAQYFASASTLGAGKIETDPAKLAAVARETLKFMRSHRGDRAVQAGLFNEFGVSLAVVEKTLDKIARTVEEDTQAKRAQRILSPAYLEKEFKLMRWTADSAGAKQNKVALPDKRLRITKYLVYEAKGLNAPTADHCCALYAIPPDESNLTPEQAEAQKSTLIRYKYTKQQVVSGALKDKGVKPLVWLTRQGLEDALLQGSILVTMSDGKKRMFNVHRNNGITYDRTIKEPRLQRRYWYFKEVAGILGYGQDDKIIVQPGVTFAGDVFNLGLGKLIAIKYQLQGKPVMRLGVLADTGGAFVPNLYQLDYLAGVYPDRASFNKAVSVLPEFAETYVLIAR